MRIQPKAMTNLVNGIKSAAGLFLVLYLSSCTSKTQADAARAAYAADMAKCVAISNTLAESKACRKAVKERWGIEESNLEATQ